jgi:hypothetical protein
VTNYNYKRQIRRGFLSHEWINESTSVAVQDCASWSTCSAEVKINHRGVQWQDLKSLSELAARLEGFMMMINAHETLQVNCNRSFKKWIDNIAESRSLF